MIGDDNAFEDNGLGNGWAWDDLLASYAASVGGLQFNENTAQIVITPGDATGTPAHVEVQPSSANLSIRNLLTTAPAGEPLAVRISGRVDAIELAGTVPPGARAVRNVSVPNPTLYFAAAVKSALMAHGIEISGPVEDIDAPSLPVDRSGAVSVAAFQSPPLSAIAATMMELSQNLFAETLLKTLGGWVNGQGSAAAGRAATMELLTEWGIAPGDVATVDGSGLSRYNLITSEAQVALLAHVYRDSVLRGPFLDALPTAGVDGTLENRMKGTRAEGNARAKTGSFSNARGLAGFVRSADGEVVAFSILANNYGVSPTLVDKATDAIVVALSQFTRR